MGRPMERSLATIVAVSKAAAVSNTRTRAPLRGREHRPRPGNIAYLPANVFLVHIRRPRRTAKGATQRNGDNPRETTAGSEPGVVSSGPCLELRIRGSTPGRSNLRGLRRSWAVRGYRAVKTHLQNEPAWAGLEGEQDDRQARGKFNLLRRQDLRRSNRHQAAGKIALGGADDQVCDFAERVFGVVVKLVEDATRKAAGEGAGCVVIEAEADDALDRPTEANDGGQRIELPDALFCVHEAQLACFHGKLERFRINPLCGSIERSISRNNAPRREAISLVSRSHGVWNIRREDHFRRFDYRHHR